MSLRDQTRQRSITVLRVEESGAFVRIEVADTGIGIPELELDRIFERFYRVDKGRSRQLGGTGLGLSIVRHWVEKMGGETFVESQVGEWSKFSFTLPRSPATSSA